MDLKRGGTTPIRQYLTGRNNDFSWYARSGHETDLEALKEFLVSQPQDKKLSEFVKKANIIDALPISFDEYSDDLTEYINFSIETIDNKTNCGRTFCLLIIDHSIGSSEKIVRSKAKEIVEKKGFGAKDYSFEYRYESLSARAGDD